MSGIHSFASQSAVNMTSCVGRRQNDRWNAIERVWMYGLPPPARCHFAVRCGVTPACARPRQMLVTTAGTHQTTAVVAIGCKLTAAAAWLSEHRGGRMLIPGWTLLFTAAYTRWSVGLKRAVDGCVGRQLCECTPCCCRWPAVDAKSDCRRQERLRSLAWRRLCYLYGL